MKHSKHTLNAAVSASLWLSFVAAPACSDALSDARGDLEQLLAEAEQEANELSTSDAVMRVELSEASAAERESSGGGGGLSIDPDGSSSVTLTPDDESGSVVLTPGGVDAGVVVLTPDEADAPSLVLAPDEADAPSVVLTPSDVDAPSVVLTPGAGDSRSVARGADAGAVVLGPPVSVVGSGSSRVRIVGTNGSGCAGREATVSAIADDLSSFSIDFGGYTAALGPDRTIQRQNCIFMIEIDPPPGMTYAVTNVPLSGQANLQDDATGRIATQYFYQGVSMTSGTGANIPATVGAWSTDGAFAADQIQSAPCNDERALVLNTSAVVNGEVGQAPSSVTVAPVFSVQLALSACP